MTKSPIEQAREFLAGYEDGFSCAPFPNKHTATLADHLRQVIGYAESLERVNKAAREFKAAWDKDVNFETLLAKDKLFQEIENAGE